MRHLADAPPARLGAGSVLLPGPAPLRQPGPQHHMYQLHDGEIICIASKRATARELAERRREKEVLLKEMAAQQDHESMRAAAALQLAAKEAKQLRQRHEWRQRAVDDEQPPRFRVGERVEVNLGKHRWSLGRVVEINCDAPHMSIAGRSIPYQVRLDIGGLLTIPLDDNHVIRRARGRAQEQPQQQPQPQGKPCTGDAITADQSGNRRMPADVEKAIAAAIREKVESGPGNLRIVHAGDAVASSEKTEDAVSSGFSTSEDPDLCRAALALAHEAFGRAPIDPLRTATAGGVGPICSLLVNVIGPAGSVPTPLLSVPSKLASQLGVRSPFLDAKPSGQARAEEMTAPTVRPATAKTADALAALTLETAVTAAPHSVESIAAALASLAATTVNHALAKRASKLAKRGERVSHDSFVDSPKTWTRANDEHANASSGTDTVADFLRSTGGTRGGAGGAWGSAHEDAPAADMLDGLADSKGKVLEKLLREDGRSRQVSGLLSSKRHLKGIRWDDKELIRVAQLIESGHVHLESLEVPPPNSVGSAGVRALCRALLVGRGAHSLTALRLKADVAVDADLQLLAATLAARDTRLEAKGEPGVEPRSGGDQPRAVFVAAPQLFTIDVDGGKLVSSVGRQAIAAARRARQAHAPVTDSQMRRLAAAARMPLLLQRFRRVLDACDDSPAHTQLRAKLFESWDGNGTGSISLAELGTGLLGTLCSAYGSEGTPLYHRFYRMYIRAFNDTRAGEDGMANDGEGSGTAISGFRVGGEYITRPQFRRLLLNLRLYATWYEVFMLVDGGTRGRTADDDHRISRKEYYMALEQIRAAGDTWAPYAAFVNASESDFDAMNRDRGGFLTLAEWFNYVRAAERAAGKVVTVQVPPTSATLTHTLTSLKSSMAAPKTAATTPMAPPAPLAHHLPKEAFVVKDGRLYTQAELEAIKVKEREAKDAEERAVTAQRSQGSLPGSPPPGPVVPPLPL